MLFDFTDQHFFFDLFSMHFFAEPVNPHPTITKQDLGLAHTSRLLHEITHLDCMRTDLGVGSLIAILWLRNKFTEVGDNEPVITSDRIPLVNPFTGTPILIRNLLAKKVVTGITEAVAVLEGLAMFTQLDMKFSSEEVSSIHFRAILSLLQQSGTISTGSPTDIISSVSDYYNQQRICTRVEEHTFEKLLFGVTRTNSYYLFGYVFIKSLASILCQKVPRFRHPEMAYLFLKTFLLNGVEYITGILDGPGKINISLQHRLEILRNCPADRLLYAYELISKDTTDNLSGVDWAYFLVTGELRSATNEKALRNILNGLNLDHDELMSVLISMDFVPLKMVQTWISSARRDGDQFQLSLISGNEKQFVKTYKWISGKAFSALVTEAHLAGKDIPMSEYCDVSISNVDINSIRNPLRVPMLWSSSFLVEKLLPIDLYSSYDIVFSDKGLSIEVLEGPEFSYLNFFRRRALADFMFDVFGQKLPWTGGMLMDFSLFVYQNLMRIKGGKNLERIVENGFARVSLPSFSLTPDGELPSKISDALNQLLLYPIFE